MLLMTAGGLHAGTLATYEFSGTFDTGVFRGVAYTGQFTYDLAGYPTVQPLSAATLTINNVAIRLNPGNPSHIKVGSYQAGNWAFIGVTVTLFIASETKINNQQLDELNFVLLYDKAPGLTLNAFLPVPAKQQLAGLIATGAQGGCDHKDGMSMRCQDNDLWLQRVTAPLH
jgi:hypothetical protein